MAVDDDDPATPFLLPTNTFHPKPSFQPPSPNQSVIFTPHMHPPSFISGHLRELFRKELTPSDVGKLNRLVVPKKHAIKFFPNVAATASGEEGGAAEGVMLEFRDAAERRWEFRYCYWKSSQSFVFTKGWNKFVKMNQLRSKDVVTFYGGEERDGFTSFFFIEASRHSQLLEEPVLHRFLSPGGEEEETTPKKALRLFGVQID